MDSFCHTDQSLAVVPDTFMGIAVCSVGDIASGRLVSSSHEVEIPADLFLALSSKCSECRNAVKWNIVYL